jgi:hypothetical protein
MKKITIKIASFLVAIVALASFAGNAFAQTYIHANGGSYWTQSGTGWNSINNDGYCVSGRAPCFDFRDGSHHVVVTEVLIFQQIISSRPRHISDVCCHLQQIIVKYYI